MTSLLQMGAAVRVLPSFTFIPLLVATNLPRLQADLPLRRR